MDKNNKKILLVLALMFFILTIGRFLPGDGQENEESQEYTKHYVEGEDGEKIILTVEDMELAEELSEYLSGEKIPEFFSLNLECILQLPELPTGCEVTSLAIVLQYLGFPADKCDLADHYLKKGPAGKTTMYESFWGDPYSWRGFGCFAPVIVECANDYLGSIGVEDMLAFDISGTEFENLFAEIADGNPVIIWNTIDLAEPSVSSTWEINGEKFEWKAPEHCVVMYGYDAQNGIVKISDPLKGNRICSAYLFKDRYIKMGMQAVVIHTVDER